MGKTMANVGQVLFMSSMCLIYTNSSVGRKLRINCVLNFLLDSLLDSLEPRSIFTINMVQTLSRKT